MQKRKFAQAESLQKGCFCVIPALNRACMQWTPDFPRWLVLPMIRLYVGLVWSASCRFDLDLQWNPDFPRGQWFSFLCLALKCQLSFDAGKGRSWEAKAMFHVWLYWEISHLSDVWISITFTRNLEDFFPELNQIRIPHPSGTNHSCRYLATPRPRDTT